MYIRKIFCLSITICAILLFSSSGIARNFIRSPLLLESSFVSGGHVYKGVDIANLFDAYNATGDLFAIYGVQQALFFKDDKSDMYVAAIHEKTNTLMIQKINIENMVKLNDAMGGSSIDQDMIDRLKKEDPAFGLVFQPTATLARGRSYGGFAEEVVDRDFPDLSQLYAEFSDKIVQIKKAIKEENKNTSTPLSPTTSGVTTAGEPTEEEMLSALQGKLDEVDQQARNMSDQCKNVGGSKDPYIALACMFGSIRSRMKPINRYP
ncbi:MAG TPA: hypothetical protein PKV73_18530 [Agriterribacter sp.]|nr:hypothetical protein [Agriterribacter sp.]